MPLSVLVKSFVKSSHLKKITISPLCQLHRRTLMKAVVMEEFGGPHVLKVKEIPIPEPKPSEILIKVHAAGLNPVDICIREGEFMTLPKLPIVLGKGVAGVVDQVGEDVKNFKIGDRVVGCLPYNGGYAEYATCKAEEAFPLSKRLSFSQGAALYVGYFTAYRALVTKGNIRKNEFLLVHGASGSVGIAAVQIAKARGLMVAGTAGSDAGMDVVRHVGADHVFNHNVKGASLQEFAFSGGKGFDMILETNAHLNLAHDLYLLAQRGRVAIVGTRGTSDINPRSLIYTEGSVFGVKLIGVTRDEFVETTKTLINGIEEGWVNPVIEKEYTMRFAKKAHEDLLDRCGAKGKLVFKMV